MIHHFHEFASLSRSRPIRSRTEQPQVIQTRRAQASESERRDPFEETPRILSSVPAAGSNESKREDRPVTGFPNEFSSTIPVDAEDCTDAETPHETRAKAWRIR